MTMIAQLSQFRAVVSELTHRTIYINESLDCYLISPAIDFAKLAQVSENWLARVEGTRAEARPPPSMRSAVAALSRTSTREAVASALDTILVKEFRNRLDSSSVASHQRYLVELMLDLWGHGAVAWPAKEQVPFTNPSLIATALAYCGESAPYLTRIRSYLDRGGCDDSANFRYVLDNILSRVGIADIGDLTPATFYMTPERTRMGKMRSTGILAVLSALREPYHSVAIRWTAEDFGFFKARMGRLARDDEFTWLLSEDPSMADWARLAIEHLDGSPTNFKKRKSSINNFLKHFLSNRDLPRSPVEYFDIRRRPKGLYEVAGNQGRQTMSVINDFLNEVLFKVCSQPNDNELPVLMPGFANPHPRTSYANVNKGETHREAMPTRLITLAKHILTENNFAWARDVGRLSDSFRRANPDTGQFETVWSPVRSYAILLRLTIPPRTYQIRMLDSGEGDTWSYRGNSSWVRNTGPHRPRPSGPLVEKGVFRRYKRKDGSEGAVFYFNTNKTGDIDKVVKGYVMPWEQKEALETLIKMREWQLEFNSVRGPTSWVDIAELKKIKHAEDLAKMGVSFFLFRDPANNTRPDLPVTDVRLRDLWLKLMDEMERRLAATGETLNNGDPIKLVLSRDKRGQPTSATFDLHTLRVSIVTAMYEEGVPPEILMKIVGHATVLMTLYYVKLNAETMSLRMNEAVLERQRKSQAEMAGFITRASRAEWLC